MTNNLEHNFLITLINAVKEYPQLYNYHKYPPGIRDIQNECGKIWTIISETLGEPRELCKKKWQVVRGSYLRYLKQIDIAKVPYYLSEHMDFLLPLYSNKVKPEIQILTNSDDDDYATKDIDENKSNYDDDDWMTDSMLKHEIDNDSEIQPFESISIDEEILSQNNQSKELKIRDKKYYSDMPFAIKLLNNIKKYPDLYATGKTVSDTTLIWKKISEDLGETQENCRKKWRIIRGSYQRYLKRIDISPTPYYLSEDMKFLLPFYGDKYLPKSHRYLVNECLEINTSDNNYENATIDDDDVNDDWEEINFIDINKKKRKANEDIDDNINNTTIPESKIIKIKSDIEDNSDLIFLKSLLPDLKSLDTNKKITFRISVLNLVKELLEKK